MRQKHLKLEEKKEKILSYIAKNPLSSIRKIADNYRGHKSRIDDTKTVVQQLHKENRIQKIFEGREFYFITPQRGKERDTLIQIINSDKVFQNRFKKIPFRGNLQPNKPLFTQVAENCIALFHLHFKIFRLEIKKSHVRRKLISFNKLRRKFLTKFMKLLESHSYRKIISEGIYTYTRNENTEPFDNPSNEKILHLLFNYILAIYQTDKIFFKNLSHNKLSLKETFNRICIIQDETTKDTTELSGISRKAIRKTTNSFLYSREKFKSGELLNKWMLSMQVEKNRGLKEVTNDELGQVFDPFWKDMKKQVIIMKKVREKQWNEPEFKENDGLPIPWINRYPNFLEGIISSFDTS